MNGVRKRGKMRVRQSSGVSKLEDHKLLLQRMQKRKRVEEVPGCVKATREQDAKYEGSKGQGSTHNDRGAKIRCDHRTTDTGRQEEEDRAGQRGAKGKPHTATNVSREEEGPAGKGGNGRGPGRRKRNCGRERARHGVTGERAGA